MSLNDLTKIEAVITAINEFDSLGRESFLEKYGFGEARSYFILYGGRRYDSKAIAGVAYGFQFPERGCLKPADFSGGESTVVRKLQWLGFEIIGEKPKSYHQLIFDLINRIYKKPNQKTTRIILRTYFTQKPNEKKLTLEGLGKLPELDKEVSKQRAEQVMKKFTREDLPKEIERLNRAIEESDVASLENKIDLIKLQEIIELIIRVSRRFK